MAGQMSVIILMLVIPFAHGRHKENLHKIMDSASEYYLFEPLLMNSHCISCTKADNVISTKLDNGAHVPGFEFLLNANGTSFHISLELNDGLFPLGFSVSYLGYDWERPKTYKEELHEIDNCYYHGHVIGIEHSHVIASTCYGLKGTIYLPNDVLHFVPLDGDDLVHALYREKKSSDFSCGNSHNDFFHRSITASRDIPQAPIRLKRAEKEQKFIELLFVANKELFEKFPTREELNDHVKEVVNYIDGLYRKIELRVVLLHLEVWTKVDKIQAETNAQKVLSHFLAYRTDKVLEAGNPNSPWKYTDNAQLLFGGDFDGNTLGMATVSSMCGLRSGGVNQDRAQARNTASTITHEMGHNLGMSHDSDACTCTGQKCVMAATAGFTAPDAWTECSVEDLKRGYRNGNGVCLSNVPDSSKLFGGPKCGNGIIEKDEECDCGTVDECESRCCNATTCMLHEGAVCDSGTCCTADCQYKDSCHICRSTENDCDITEYCTGHSAHCPGNVHKLDGLKCNSEAGSCYGGVCRTHESQCKEMWGADATNGPDLCYNYVNALGNWNGNCGKQGSKFKPCAADDVLCGKLICMGGKDAPQLATNRRYALIRTSSGSEQYVCKTVQSVNGTSDSGDVSSVSDGTMCGHGKICFNSKCVNTSTVFKTCKMDCHGHGVCNNYGNCHCDAGYGPPDCKNKGNGGSLESGPICATTVELQVILLLVFFLVILPLVLGLFFYVWWRVCGGRQKMYAWRKNRKYRQGQRNPGQKDNITSRDKAAPVTSSPDDSYFSSLEPASSSYPAVTGIAKRPQQPKRPSAPAIWNATRPAPPNRPSPRFPPRNAPPPPDQPKKVTNPPRPPVPYNRGGNPTVGFRGGPHGNSSNNSNPSSVQDRITQLQKGNSNWS